ncbi:DUF350 domain-containing protein [Candidatus Latescibacterota bacterium]
MLEAQLMAMARAVVYVLEAFVLLWIAKAAYTRVYRRVCLKAELFDKGNTAVAVAACGYLLGIIIALGGVLTGPSGGWQADLTGIAQYGLLTVAMMLVASFLCEKVLLSRFDNTKEVVEDQNLGTAFVEAGVHIANGLIVLAVLQGEGVWWVGLVFWGLAQVVLMLAGRLYQLATPHDIHAELERDNAAVGLAFGGVLVGMGNIVSIAVAGDFIGWQSGLTTFAVDVVFGFVVLFLIKKLTDVLLAPGVRLGEQQTQATPQIGAGLLEALGYVGGSMLIVWVF